MGFTEKARASIIIHWLAFDSGYHLYAEKQARAHRLKGTMRVKHLPLENYLHMEVEGAKAKILALLEDLKRGPAAALTQRAEVQWKTYKKLYHDFRVQY